MATVASWFATRSVAALLTLRVRDLILRSIATRCVWKNEATEPDLRLARQDASAFISA
jgi:hypothetical protein